MQSVTIERKSAFTGLSNGFERQAVLQPDGAGTAAILGRAAHAAGTGGRRGQHLDVPLRAPPDGAAAIVSFIGHSTFLIQTTAGNPPPIRLLPACQPVQLRRAAARSTAGNRVRQSAANLDRPAQPQPLQSLRPADARRLARLIDPNVVLAFISRLPALGAVGRADQGRGTGLVAGRDVGALANHADTGASLLGANAVQMAEGIAALWGGFSLVAGGGGGASLPATPPIRRTFQRYDGELGPMDWRCCESAPPAPAGS